MYDTMVILWIGEMYMKMDKRVYISYVLSENFKKKISKMKDIRINS